MVQGITSYKERENLQQLIPAIRAGLSDTPHEIIVVDDTSAIDFVGTRHVLVLGIRNHLLEKEDALKAVDEMVEAGWRCGPELYREIIRLIQAG